jgi:hypothetical protein
LTRFAAERAHLPVSQLRDATIGSTAGPPPPAASDEIDGVTRTRTSAHPDAAPAGKELAGRGYVSAGVRPVGLLHRYQYYVDGTSAGFQEPDSASGRVRATGNPRISLSPTTVGYPRKGGRRAPAKPAIRVALHKQITALRQSGALAESTNERLANLANPNSAAESRKRHLFLPLVRTRMTASLDVLTLRGDGTSRLVIEGDIGNRLTTLSDALSVPRPEQVPPAWSPACRVGSLAVRSNLPVRSGYSQMEFSHVLPVHVLPVHVLPVHVLPVHVLPVQVLPVHVLPE